MIFIRLQHIQNFCNRSGLAIAASLAVAGCASISPYGTTDVLEQVKIEPKEIAAKLGLRGCRVSIPMSQSEVIEDAKRIGNPYPEKYSEWAEIIKNYQPGDQLRAINCEKLVSATYYYALFRRNTMILQFFPMIFD